MADLIIFDLDGTLADIEHRQHLARGPDKNWDQFFAGIHADTPRRILFDLMTHLQTAGYEVQIWSGRPEKTRTMSEDWLRKHGCALKIARMRPDGDFQPDDKLKESWLHSLKVKPVMVYDDRDRVVAMWRKNGILCAQVADGDF